MSMLDRRTRPSAEPDEETVRRAAKDFRRRRRSLARRGWRRRLLILLAVLLAIGLVAGSVWLVFFSSHVAVRSALVTGNDEVSNDRIVNAAEVPIGTPLARVDLDAIQERVEEIPAVRRAEVSRNWPHRVHVVVTERIPIAVVDAKGGLQSLDAEGVLFGSYDKRPARLPLVKTGSGVSDEAVAEGGRVIDSLPVTVAAKVDTIEIDSIDRISLNFRSGRQVLWGSAEDSAQKAQVLAVLLANDDKVIDVTVPGRPTTR